MTKSKITGILLDVDSEQNMEEEAIIRLFVKSKNRIEIYKDIEFRPYFYVIVDDIEKTIKDLKEMEFEKEGKGKFKILSVEKVEKANAKSVLKLVFRNVSQLVAAREEIKNLPAVLERREYDIPFTRRYLIDKQLTPLEKIELEVENENIKEVKTVYTGEATKLMSACFDLETLSPGRFSNAGKDPIIMISYADDEESIVWTFKNEALEKLETKDLPYLKILKDEKAIIQALSEKIKEKNLDVIMTYNGDRFDLPYVKERAAKCGIKFDIASDKSEPTIKQRAGEQYASLKGVQHVDVYQMMRFLGRIGAVNLIKYDLESVVEAVFGKKKYKVSAEEINTIWETGKDLGYLVIYNREDAESTLKLGEEYIQLFVEMSKLVRQTLFDVNRTSTGQLVEQLLINKSFELNNLIPNKPSDHEVKQRLMQTYQGGYVKEPVSGLHENIAVLDFRSLHPTIMISHNISPETIDCECCKNGKHLCPSGNWFCEKNKGFFSGILENILEKRIELKQFLKKMKAGSLGYKAVNAKQHSLKILLNSFYGSLGYARFRWYNRDCAKAVTAWSRHYITEVINKAEKNKYVALYSDTDSVFLHVSNGKNEKDILEFVKKINLELPGAMELEFEGMYKRGIFVTKKEGGAAKKRYALIDYDGNLKIVGFEYVRRDWSVIAKKTQRAVIQAVLSEGKPEKAIEIVKNTIEQLRSGKVKKSELTIMTQIKKSIKDYVAIGPHIAAAKKAIKRGKEMDVGSVISFIITRSGKSISDKAELEEYVEEGNYDSEYYIENQIIPAVIKIMRELDYDRDDLLHGGKQSSLASFG